MRRILISKEVVGQKQENTFYRQQVMSADTYLSPFHDTVHPPTWRFHTHVESCSDFPFSDRKSQHPVFKVHSAARVTCAAFGSRPRLGSPYLTASALASKGQLGIWAWISAVAKARATRQPHMASQGESYRINSNHPANIPGLEGARRKGQVFCCSRDGFTKWLWACQNIVMH